MRDVMIELSIVAGGVGKQIDALGGYQWRMPLERSSTKQRGPISAVVGRYRGPLPESDEGDGSERE